MGWRRHLDGQLPAPLLAGIHPRQLGDDSVEPLQQPLQLTVGDLSVVHGD
jgi:hypothetical protein